MNQPLDAILDQARMANLPHLDQYFGPWAMHVETFESLVGRFGGLNLASHMAMGQPRQRMNSGDYEVTDDGVAVIQIHGTMTKYGGSMTGPGTVEIRSQVRDAARNQKINAIVLHIDSPGGTVSGTRDLAMEIVAARAQKPVYAYIEDMGASAAYWVASQADKVFANDTALVGSIGTFAVIQDMSGWAGQVGIKVHVIHAGEYKGAATPGTEVTEKQLAEFQRVVNELNDHFISGIASGRKMSPDRVQQIADGRVHVGKAALALGLVDGIKSMDEILVEAARPARQSDNKHRAETPADESNPHMEDSAMSENETALAGASQQQEQAASYAELKASLVGADSEFICKQLDAKATLSAATSAWMIEQNARIEQARVEAKAAKSAGTGVAPLTCTAMASASETTDPVQAWNDALDAKVKSGIPKAMAVASLAKEQPELRQAMVETYNSQRAQ